MSAVPATGPVWADQPVALRFVEELLALDPSCNPSVTDKAALCLLDFLSCAFAGRDMLWAQQAIAANRSWPAPSGATIIGTDLRLSPTDAAYINSVMAASASRTDMHAAVSAHAAPVVIPTVLAIASVAPVSGQTFLNAIVAGYEAIARLGRIVVSERFRRHFRATSVLGSVGGAVAAARALQLDRTEAVNALAISANAAAGLMEWGHSGEVDLFYQPANAARAAVAAAFLAREGARASASILDGPGGFLAAFGDPGRACELLRGESPDWEIERVEFKPVPACVFVQAAAHATQAMVERHEPEPERIEAIAVRTFGAAIAYPGCDNPGPIDKVQSARMSLQHTVASVLARGDLTDKNFVELDHAGTRRLTPRVELATEQCFDEAFPRSQGAEVEVRMSDGKVLSSRIDDVPAFGADKVRARFRRTAAEIMNPKHLAALEMLCGSLPDQDSVQPLIELLGHASRARQRQPTKRRRN